jgi:superoxide dismutase, Cu-Zn family
MNIRNLLAPVAMGVLALAACGGGGHSDGETHGTDSSVATHSNDTVSLKSARATISATKADTAGGGTAIFTAVDEKEVELKLTLDFPKKANQTVAVHFHEHGDCGDEGKGAHGHWNPTNEKHGKWDDKEHHSGDIGNIALDGQGKAEFTVKTDRWSIGGAEKTNILKKAIIVHSGVDDYTTQPTGNSGSRIGCGVISE